MVVGAFGPGGAGFGTTTAGPIGAVGLVFTGCGVSETIVSQLDSCPLEARLEFLLLVQALPVYAWQSWRE